MSTDSLWRATRALQTFPRLKGDLETDVLIVGAGLSGLTAALLLQRAGRRVTVIDSRRTGSGETGNTTAHLTELLDARYHVLESKLGGEEARTAADSSRAAIARIEAFSREIGESCRFRRVPAFLFAETPRQRRELEKELDCLQRFGADVGWTDTLPLPLRALGAIRLEQQAQFHPLEYLRGLVSLFVDAGGALFEGTRALEFHDGEPCLVKTPVGEIRANEVLVLTNAPVSSRFTLHTKIAAYRTYAIALRPSGSWPEALLYDMRAPYHYVRLQENDAGRFVVVGGEDHKTGKKSNTDECFRKLEEYSRQVLGLKEVEYRWSGQVIEPADGLPFIGRSPFSRHVHVATGFSGTGLTFGTVSAMVLSDAVLGLSNPWAELYDATRVRPLAQAHEYVTENVDYPAHIVRDRFDRGEVSSPDEIPPGEGRLMRSGGKMLAVFKDEAGTLHTHSAVCPHLGCHVHWNNGERTWDCPCHGSRFAVDGSVENGPTTKDLAEQEVEQPAEHPES